MKLKKLASMAMAGVMAVSLAACGGSDTAKTTAADAATTAEAETTAAAEDAETKETEASAVASRAYDDHLVSAYREGCASGTQLCHLSQCRKHRRSGSKTPTPW